MKFFHKTPGRFDRSTMSVSMDELNYLVWRYMQENGFPHTAFVFDTECNASSTNISGSQVPPMALITLLQKSLVYLRIEKKIRELKKDPGSNVRPELEKIEKVFTTEPASGPSETALVQDITSENATFLKSNSQAICSVKFSPDGNKVATLQADGTCTIWSESATKSVVCGKPSVEMTRCRSAISWNSTSDLVALAGDAETYVFDLNGETVATISGDSTVVQFCPERNLLAVCSRSDYSVTIYEIKNGAASQLESFSNHKDVIYDASWRDQGVLATAARDKCVGVFTVAGGAQLLRSHTQPVTVVAFNSGNMMMGSGGDDGNVHVWKDPNQATILKGHAGGITGLAWHPVNHGLLASSSVDGSVKVWDVLSGECQFTMAHHMKGITTLQFHPNGRYLITGGRDKVLAIWSYPDGKMVQAFTIGSEVNSLDIDASGKFVVVCFGCPSAVVISLEKYCE